MADLDDLCRRLRSLDRIGPTIHSDAADAIDRLRVEIEDEKAMRAHAERDARELRADAERWRYTLRQIPADLGMAFCGHIAADEDIVDAIDAALRHSCKVDD